MSYTARPVSRRGVPQESCRAYGDTPEAAREAAMRAVCRWYGTSDMAAVRRLGWTAEAATHTHTAAQRQPR